MHSNRGKVSRKIEEWCKMRVIILCVYMIFILAGCGMLSEEEGDFSIIAHRGASAYGPEHTIPAYEMALKQNADYLEIDLQMTADGVLISMHDETVNRTTNGKGFVRSLTLEEIKELDAGTWFNDEYPDLAKQEFQGLTVPTLEEIIEHFGTEVSYYIETKSPSDYPGMEEELLAILDRFGLIAEKPGDSKVIIQSFSVESLKKIHSLKPTIPLIQLLSYDKRAVLTDEEIPLVKEYAVGIGPNHESIDKEYVQKAREAGLEVHPYTINDEKLLRKYLGWGITGAFTNYPDVAYEVCCLGK
jgi:glycerophosphoryl diester phosphodiesterase